MNSNDSKPESVVTLDKNQASQVSDALNSANSALLAILRLWAASEMTTDTDAADMIKDAAEAYAVAVRRQLDGAQKLFPAWIDIPF